MKPRKIIKGDHNKPTYPATRGNTSFENLPDDIKTDILCRLQVKLLGRFMIVSKSWRRVIVVYCFPKLLFSPKPYTGILIRQEIMRNPRDTNGLPYALVAYRDYRCSKEHETVYESEFSDFHNTKLPFKLQDQKLLDCCNGLILVCRYVESRAKSQRIYTYYVINPLIKQYVSVVKPNPRSSLWMYAALAYDPSESSYFKIVRFQSKKRLHIYSSENKRWIIYGFRLENNVIRNKWERWSVYLNGAIYRLSNSGHLLRFIVNKKVNVKAQARAIDLPKNDTTCQNKRIGLNKGCVNFGWCDDQTMKIWVLRQKSSDNDDDYEWCLKYNIVYNPISNNRKLLAFHPYLDFVFVGYSSRWMYGHQLEQRVDEGQPLLIAPYIRSAQYDDESTITLFPVVQCNVPFVSGKLDYVHT